MNQTTIGTRIIADNEVDVEVVRSLLTNHGGSLTFETERRPRNDVLHPSPRGDPPRRASQASCISLALRGGRAERPRVAIAVRARAPCRGRSCCSTGDAFGTEVAPTNAEERVPAGGKRGAVAWGDTGFGPIAGNAARRTACESHMDAVSRSRTSTGEDALTPRVVCASTHPSMSIQPPSGPVMAIAPLCSTDKHGSISENKPGWHTRKLLGARASDQHESSGLLRMKVNGSFGSVARVALRPFEWTCRLEPFRVAERAFPSRERES